MFRPQGYGRVIGFNGTQAEHDTFTCSHCNRIVIVKPMSDPADMGGQCKMCDKLICPACVGHGCTPFEERLKEMEMRDVERRRSYGG